MRRTGEFVLCRWTLRLRSGILFCAQDRCTSINSAAALSNRRLFRLAQGFYIVRRIPEWSLSTVEGHGRRGLGESK